MAGFNSMRHSGFKLGAVAMGLLRSFLVSLVGFHCMGGSNMDRPWGGSYVIKKKKSFIMNLTLNACIN